MKQTLRKFDAAFKRKVAIEALRVREMLSGLAVQSDLHSPTKSLIGNRDFMKNLKIIRIIFWYLRTLDESQLLL